MVSFLQLSLIKWPENKSQLLNLTVAIEVNVDNGLNSFCYVQAESALSTSQ